MLNSPRGANPPTKNPRLLRWKFTLLLEALEIHIWILVGWRTGSFAASIVEHVENSTFKQLYRFGSTIYIRRNHATASLLLLSGPMTTSYHLSCKKRLQHFKSHRLNSPVRPYEERTCHSPSFELSMIDRRWPEMAACPNVQKPWMAGQEGSPLCWVSWWIFWTLAVYACFLKDFNGSRDVQVQHSLLDRLNKRGSLQRRCWLPNPGCLMPRITATSIWGSMSTRQPSQFVRLRSNSPPYPRCKQHQHIANKWAFLSKRAEIGDMSWPYGESINWNWKKLLDKIIHKLERMTGGFGPKWEINSNWPKETKASPNHAGSIAWVY